VIPLAVTNSGRNTLLPDVPTVHELGFDDLALEGSLSFFAPRDMTPALFERIGADIRSAGAALSADERLNASGLVARTTTASELKNSLDREREKIKAAIALGVVPSSK
jgi:tripartite-type tricarboxylate transporter receptor subunit TctC